MKDKFQESVANHKMTIELDQGMHRCIYFGKPNSGDCHFRIVTWPGHLAISGDMGDFVFQRLTDMFEFFRGEKINPSYWSEKVQAQSVFGSGVQKYSQEKFLENVRGWIKDYWDIDDDGVRSTITDAIVSSLRHDSEDESLAYRAVMDFDAEVLNIDVTKLGLDPSNLTFQDFWETSPREFTYHYLWCCHAIVWAIQQYDEAKAEVSA